MTTVEESGSGESYRAAGVDLDAGEEAVRRIGPLVRGTYRPEVMGDIGGFGGLFDIGQSGYRDPLLVSATDGVGTKAEIARQTGRLDTIGWDLVAMCVDDLVCVGAAPLFFLDYLAVGRLDPDAVEGLVSGIAAGCIEAGCALIGGEMAEHPGVMATDQFDLVGFAVGAVERDGVLDGSAAVGGDVLGGISSTGLHANGYSLVRKIIETNLLSVFNILEVVVPVLRSQNQRSQLAICASAAGYVGLPGSQPYGSSKAGLIHLVESLKAEYGKSIDIKLINPGFVESRLTDKNEFYMPFRITAEKAAKRISSGLNSRKFEIHFPKRFTYLMKLVAFLPYSIYFFFFRQLNDDS